MLFMVIERFKNRDAKAVYSRFKELGRMMPNGLTYVGSWVEDNFDRCFQLMECDDPQIFQQWLVHWEDLSDFEIIHVVSSAEAADAALSAISHAWEIAERAASNMALVKYLPSSLCASLSQRSFKRSSGVSIRRSVP